MVQKLFDFIKNSPTAFQAADTVKARLLSEGFEELLPGDGKKPEAGGKYFLTSNGSSLIAFIYSGKKDRGFLIGAAHSDCPAYRVKKAPTVKGTYARLSVEGYGGMIHYTWLDRPLSVAGRVFVRTEKGIKECRVSVDRDLLVIPSLAIHMNRGVNDGYKFNPATDLLPLFGGKDGETLETLLAKELSCAPEDIVSHDLFLVTRQAGRTFGQKDEFILCPRLDDLECAFTSLEGFLSAKKTDCTPVYALFDNEEVGSATKQGAASTFLRDVLYRISGDEETYAGMLYQSFMVSADNAHAVHPNHPELADPTNAPVLNGGVAVKFNASQRYATDGMSDAVLGELCRRAGVKLQTYYNRADIPGGGTLGSISDTRVSVPTVDIGLPQLAMHSAVETAGAEDILEAVKLFTAFYGADYYRKGDNYTF